MGWINVFIANPCSVSVQKSQLLLAGDREMRFPIEDINSVMIETSACTISVAALGKLSAADAVVFVCDEKHLPAAVLLPYQGYSRQLKMLRAQLSVKKPLTKQLWQAIVKQKIANQARCAEICGKDAAALWRYSAGVSSGDSEHSEAAAASLYFKLLFGGDFVRAEDVCTNAILNYGYAVIRGSIARTLAVHGFEPCLGIFHCNELNAFNLADDLIEPFRPIVDQFAFLEQEEADCLTPELKSKICNLLNCNVSSGGEKHSLSYAVERLVASLQSSLCNESCELLLPELLPLSVHAYE